MSVLWNILTAPVTYVISPVVNTYNYYTGPQLEPTNTNLSINDFEKPINDESTNVVPAIEDTKNIIVNNVNNENNEKTTTDNFNVVLRDIKQLVPKSNGSQSNFKRDRKNITYFNMNGPKRYQHSNINQHNMNINQPR
jgi:hypothetical protein